MLTYKKERKNKNKKETRRKRKSDHTFYSQQAKIQNRRKNNQLEV